MATTIIYYSDGSVEKSIGKLVKKYILKSGKPIISVTQQPLDFGTNICVGDIGRSYKSIQSQVLVGALCAKTKYIALAEHDTLYPEGYFDWIPPKDDVFYYNKNRVFIVAKKGPQYGMYILYEDAHPNADQLICNRKLFIDATIQRIELLDSGKKLPTGWGEPGFNWNGESFEWRRNKIASVDIFHNDNFTVRHGCFKDTAWTIDGWNRFKDIK
ncbi:hypothetical protein LCGC14_0643800 [marine sediment metagenome]|uniref:Nucleotide-diphospho-sugar transferase domain-containing protein n=1 Tax=marine sediment metagenome TaxID=412755 RepID=A0A0F9R3K3_9ZZZZ|nr:hypothetical protein [Pricia sp.]